jgi:hypothetical protein
MQATATPRAALTWAHPVVAEAAKAVHQRRPRRSDRVTVHGGLARDRVDTSQEKHLA